MRTHIRRVLVLSALCLALLPQHPCAATAYYSFQLGSFPDKESAVLMYERIKDLPKARVEKIGEYYTVRIGFWKSRQTAEAFRVVTRRIAPDAFLRIADLKQERILIQSAHSEQRHKDLGHKDLGQKDRVSTKLTIGPAAQPTAGDRVQGQHAKQDREYVRIEESPVDIVQEQLGLSHEPDEDTNVLPQIIDLDAGFLKLEDNLLTVDLQQAPLFEVLEAISHTFGIKILFKNPTRERIVARFTALPFKQGLEKILTGKNYIFIYRGAGAHLKEIMIYGQGKEKTEAQATSHRQSKPKQEDGEMEGVRLKRISATAEQGLVGPEGLSVCCVGYTAANGHEI